nr:hypothetical protein [Tanacetum cinerariifolium]
MKGKLATFLCKAIRHLQWKAIDVDEDITLVDAETQVDLGAKLQGRKNDDNDAIKDMAKRFPDEEVEQAAAKEKQEKDDLEKAKVLQQQYVDKQENINWNVVVEQILPPEWSKFVTDVKLVKDFHTTNFDQLYAYLEQHKLHAKEVRLLRECNQDPLAFVANQQMTPPHFNTYQSSYNNP